MVSREIILKTLDTIISKCPPRLGRLSLTNAQKRRLNTFKEETKNLTYERMNWINSKGEVVFKMDGEDTQVDFSKIDLKGFVEENGYDLHIEHNHPGSYVNENDRLVTDTRVPTLLSRGDVDQLFQECEITDSDGETITVTPFKGITAEAPNGSRMTITRVDSDGENKVIIDRGGTMVKFDRAYDMLYNKWNHFMQGYESATRGYMNGYGKEQRDKGTFTKEGYLREKNRFTKQYTRDGFESKYWDDVIESFQECGFDLSIEIEG